MEIEWTLLLKTISPAVTPVSTSVLRVITALSWTVMLPPEPCTTPLPPTAIRSPLSVISAAAWVSISMLPALPELKPVPPVPPVVVTAPTVIVPAPPSVWSSTLPPPPPTALMPVPPVAVMSTREIAPLLAVIVTAPAEPPEPATAGPGVALVLLPPIAVIASVTVMLWALNVMLPAAPAPPALLLLLEVEMAPWRLIALPAVMARKPDPAPEFAAAVVEIVPAASAPPLEGVLVTSPVVAVSVTLPPALTIGSWSTTLPAELVRVMAPAGPTPRPVMPPPEASAVMVPEAVTVKVPPKVAVSMPRAPVTPVRAALPEP